MSEASDLKERMDARQIVLPDGYFNLYKRRRGSREILMPVTDLIAYLYKAAGDPAQNATAADAYRFLAEEIEKEVEGYG